MKILFFDVGLGDSIILESKGTICVIDCKKKDSSNPVLSYIKKNNIHEIKYLILSHPHIDHYSGMAELIQHFIDNKKKINYFLHTGDINPSFFQYAEHLVNNKTQLKRLLTTADQAKKSQIITKIHTLRAGPGKLKIDENYTFKCLSPSDEEIREYINRVKLFSQPGESRKKASGAANLLSTFLCIEGEKDRAILTSDCEKSTMTRMAAELELELKSQKAITVCQVPHHGSINNHSSTFWDDLFKVGVGSSIISSGHNNSNKLPDLKVVEYIHKKGIPIKCTNFVHGFKNFHDSLEQSKKSLLLDGDSTLVSNKGNDLVYELS